MENLSREAILRMVGLHDAAHMMRQLNAIQLSLEEEQGQMVAYWTEIRKSEKEISLLAGRVAENETDIGQLQVTAQQITASASFMYASQKPYSRIGAPPKMITFMIIRTP